MADAVMNGMVGDNSGQIGQGLAYVLPETKSDRYLMQVALDNRNKIYAQRAAKAKAEQDRDVLVTKTLQDKYGAPEAWQPFNQLVGKEWDKWTRDAVVLKAKGGDPTTDPTMLKKYQDIRAIGEYSKDLKTQYIEAQRAILNNPDKYDADSIKKLDDEYKDAMANPDKWYQQGASFTRPSGKGTSLSDFTKGMKGASIEVNDGRTAVKKPDEAGNYKQVFAKLAADTDTWAKPALRQFGVDLSVLPYVVDGNTIPTSDTEVRKLAEHIMNSQSKNTELAEAGIKPDDEFAGEKLYDHILQTNTGWDKVVSTLAQPLNASVSTENKRVYDAERIDVARENLAVTREREKRLAANGGTGGAKKAAQAERKKWIEDVQAQDPTAIKNLDAALQEINGKIETKGGNTYIYLPVTTKDKYGDPITRIERKKIGKKSGEAGRVLLNQVLNRLKSVGKANQLDIIPNNEDIFDDNTAVGDASDPLNLGL